MLPFDNAQLQVNDRDVRVMGRLFLEIEGGKEFFKYFPQ